MRSRGAIAAFAAALLLAAPADASQLVTWPTTSRVVPNDGKPLNVNVLLPDGYTKKKDWPVLYLLHGHGGHYDNWTKSGDVANITKGLAAVVVMPEGGDNGWYIDWWHGGERRPAWESYHLDDLVPRVDRKYHIRPGRRWHAIAGLSMGGYGAAYYATQRPGYFGSVATFSAVLSIQRAEWPVGINSQGDSYEDLYGDPDANSFYWAGHNPTALIDNLRFTRVFVTVGDGSPEPSKPPTTSPTASVAEAELRHQAEDDFVPAARKAGVDVEWQPRAGVHDWPYWKEHLAAALRWDFFKPVRNHPLNWRFSTVQRWSTAWGLKFFFPKAPDALATFERDGDVLRGTGAGTVRIRSAHGRRVVRQLPFSVSYPR